MLISYVGLLVLLFIIQDSLVFYPDTNVRATPEERSWKYDDLRLKVGEETTSAWYVYTPVERRGVILFSHGNAGNIGDRLDSIEIFRDLGFDVLVYDYGGYGKSTGKPSEERCYQDIRTLWQYLREERGYSPKEVILFGRSLGGGPTLQLATETEFAGVVVESAFLSLPKRAAEIYPWLPVRRLVRTKFDNQSKISQIGTPLLVVHSPNDTIIPYHHGKKLFELGKSPKQFLEIRGGHNDGFWVSRDTYEQGLREFFATLFAEIL